MDDLNNKRITVAGLGRFGGGIAVAKWLCAQGARVLVTDRDPAEKLADSVLKLSGLPIELCLGQHRESDFTNCDLVVTSPAVPPSSPYLIAAKDAGVPISTEIRLFIERCPCLMLGVTATKGKSTTTALLGMMLSTNFTTWVGGNIGGSLLFDLPKMTSEDLVVLELSSYMLEHLRSLKWSPHIAVVGMISQDHLDWHGSVESYVDAKKNLVRFQRPEDVAVIYRGNEISRSFAQCTAAKVIEFDSNTNPPFSLAIAGEHNQLNAQAAFTAASQLGITYDAAHAAIKDFRGLPHRLEIVHEAAGVQYVNDSIATIPEAAIAALNAFPQGKVIQIVGGYDKKLDMSNMCQALRHRAKAALCIGATAGAMQRQINDRAELCGELPKAMQRARELAQPGDVVLLSTGFPSYDQFVNFEQRGLEFARLAKQTQ